MADNGTAGGLPVPGGRPARLDSTTASPFDRSDALIVSDPYLSTSFGGAAAYYSLRLGQPCVSAVVVHLVLPVDAACIKLSSDRLFFTPETFADPQLVRVDCVDDRAATTTIAHKVYSLDRNYDRVHTPNVLVSTARSGTGSFLSYGGHLSRRQASQAPTRLNLLSAALPNDETATSIDSLDTSSSTLTLLSCTGPTNTNGGAPSELMWHVSHLASGDHFSVVAVALPQADVLLSWGTNTNGELGNGATVANAEPSPVLMAPLQRLQPGEILRVAQVACGKHHVAVVTRAAHLFTWGGNKHGQLGHGDFTARQTPCVVQFTLTTTVGSSAHRALRVKHTVERGGTNVTHVCCGAFHTLFVTHQQLILGMGYNQAGQLGLGHRLQQLKRWRSCTPAAIEALRDSSVLDIAAGQNHSACVVSNGDVFTWGCGDDGRLGTGNHESVSVPTRVETLRDSRIRARTVRCGARHTAIISDRDLLYTWGANDFGQLGCGDRHARLRPSLIAFPLFVTHGVADMSLGEFHSACVVFSGEAYAWGLDLSAGNADVGQRTTPHSVEMPDNKGERVRRVSCGWSHINMSTQQTSPDDQDGGKQSTSFVRKLERERLELRKEELAHWRAFISRGVSVVPSLSKRWSHVKGRISLVDDLEGRKRVDVRCRQQDEEQREDMLDISGPEMSTLLIATNTMEVLQLTRLVTRYVQVPIHSAIRHIEQVGDELGSRIDRYVNNGTHVVVDFVVSCY